MTSLPSQEAPTPFADHDMTVSPLTMEIQQRFARFRDRHPHSSLTAVLESGPAVNAAGVTEYVVRATISLEGRPLVSSLAAAATIEAAEDLARLRNLALAEAIMPGSERGMAVSVNSTPQRSAPPTSVSLSQTAPATAPLSAPPQSAMDYGSDDGLGDTLINLGPLAEEEGHGQAAPGKSTKPKPKPKPKTTGAAASVIADTASAPPVPEPTSIEPEAQPNQAQPNQAQPNQEFVADWSEDLAQISVELKRLNWDSKQEQEYLQRNFNKASRDDIIDHSELMDYLGYLQALPSHFEEATETDNSPIADTGLSVDEADLVPQSISELMASAGLKSGAEIPTPPPAVAPTLNDAAPDATTAASDDPLDDIIVREPEPEIEIADDGPDDELNEELEAPDESQPTSKNLSRSEMMDETARLCKQLGWKNRQGSDFLKATYNKATRKDLTDAEMMDFLEQLRSLSTTEALPY